MDRTLPDVTHNLADADVVDDTDRECLRRLGLRATIQRLLVLNALRATPGHVTAEEVMSHLGVDQSAINLATVYRTLDTLTRHGLVVRTHFGGSAWVLWQSG